MEVVRALDSRCQVPQVALGHGRMPPLYFGAISLLIFPLFLYWCYISPDIHHFLLFQQTNTKDKAGQSATVSED